MKLYYFNSVQYCFVCRSVTQDEGKSGRKREKKEKPKAKEIDEAEEEGEDDWEVVEGRTPQSIVSCLL